MRRSHWGLAAGLAVCAALPVLAASSNDAGIEGVWVCDALRPDSSTFPLIETFRDDGTMWFSSGSDLYGAGYSSRGGGQGEYREVAHDQFEYRGIENLWENADEQRKSGYRDVIAGTFYVDSTFYYDRSTDTLCTGFVPPADAESPSYSCAGTDAPEDTTTSLRRVGTWSRDLGGDDWKIKGPAVSYRCVRLDAHLAHGLPGDGGGVFDF